MDDYGRLRKWGGGRRWRGEIMVFIGAGKQKIIYKCLSWLAVYRYVTQWWLHISIEMDRRVKVCENRQRTSDQKRVARRVCYEDETGLSQSITIYWQLWRFEDDLDRMIRSHRRQCWWRSPPTDPANPIYYCPFHTHVIVQPETIQLVSAVSYRLVD